MFQTALFIAIILSLIGFLYQFFFFIKGNRSFKGKKWVPRGLNIKTFFLNTIFQIKLFNAGKLRWLIHSLVASGFLYLLVFHALDDVTSFYWFQSYQSTVDPFQFLRNLAGFFVLAGCLGFLFRRLSILNCSGKEKLFPKAFFQ